MQCTGSATLFFTSIEPVKVHHHLIMQIISGHKFFHCVILMNNYNSENITGFNKGRMFASPRDVLSGFHLLSLLLFHRDEILQSKVRDHE